MQLKASLFLVAIYCFFSNLVFSQSVTSDKLLYFNDFDEDTFVAKAVVAELSGDKNDIESVQQLNGYGNGQFSFSGNLVRNASESQKNDAEDRITFTLTNLPTHTSISVGFLVGILDSWDDSGTYGPDEFAVEVDGVVVFKEVFSRNPVYSYQEGSGTATTIYTGDSLGFGRYKDNLWDFFTETQLQNIAHTASTLTVSIYATGDGWQGGSDESMAIDNFKITYQTAPTGNSATIFRIATLTPFFL